MINYIDNKDDNFKIRMIPEEIFSVSDLDDYISDKCEPYSKFDKRSEAFCLLQLKLLNRI